MTRRVLWLTKGLGRGGTERLITTCAPHLDRGRWTVEVAYLMPSKSAYVDRLLAMGVKVHCLDAARDLDLGWTRRLRRLLAAGDFSVLHSHSPVPAAVARMATVSSGTKLVHTEHNMWDRYRRETYWANAATFARNDAVIAVSQAVADTIPHRYLSTAVRRSGVDVVLHGVDTEEVPADHTREEARRILGLPPDALVVGTIGNLTEKKDHNLLVRSFAEARRAFPHARLCIIGSGPLEDQLRRWVREAGISQVTALPGSRDDARELLPAFDLFALSSRFEGLSIALVEAMAAGLPALSTRVGGVPEVLDGSGAGRLVPARDEHAFIAALRDLLADAHLREQMGGAARQRAKAFDIRAAVRQIEGIYERVLAS
jgi:glycosyltransferase involved in cell wall biosynthesis